MLERVLELIKNKQYTVLRHEISELNPADVAAIFEEISSEEVVKIFRILPKDSAAKIFSYLPIEDQQSVINCLTAHEAAGIVDNLFADDAADLMEEMPASVVKKILAQADPETRRDINYLLKYPEDSAGSIMTVEFIDVKVSQTVDQAIQILRRDVNKSEHIDVIYVLDPSRTLLGTVSIRQLLLSAGDELIGNIMTENPITTATLTDQEEVAHMFQKYDFTTMPVVDSENRLVGIITVDDVVDIIEEEATEDIEKMAAILPSDRTYMKTGVFETWKKRIPWLLVLMVSATFTGKIIQAYEAQLATYVILTSFIPMLMDTGGNSGSQSSVSVIRGISLNEIKFSDLLSVVWKELRVGIITGATMAAASMVKLMLIDRVTLQVALVVSLTLLVTVILAKLVGCTLPLLAKKIGFDPAVMASPFITTIVDALSLVVYFNIATRLLHL